MSKKEAGLSGPAPGKDDLASGAICPDITNNNPNSQQFVGRLTRFFSDRCEQLALRVRAGQLPFIEAVDLAYSAAQWGGAVDALGDDRVQQVMARAFMGAPR
jgi:hypothetical protein